eukprot:gnl/TRDRNA2_/TRDRNA2_176173_c0_seq28.p1 gnl/TRDRNA2_/TRDRNA2_176173_c0~~gnl/TRDRNA2_/TRDRNA2_176173_c0_seq28.p1  ORF type:complete len:362 (+),score=64.66 gnl/TRDRNA2_/TRDRNA2_176173_c0_seq28:104-1189(+)
MTAVLITSLPPGFDSEQCKLLFGNFGKIDHCVVSPSNVPGEDGFCMALLAFANAEEAKFTVDTLNGQQVMGFPAPLKASLISAGGQSSSSYGPMVPYGKGGSAQGAGPYGGGGAGKGKGKKGKMAMMEMTPEAIAEAMKVGMSRAKPGSYKTTMCKFFEQNGYCQAGFECTFAHSDEELKAGIAAIDPSTVKGYKMKLCQFWEETGTCHRGLGCTWAHGIQDMRAQPQLQQQQPVMDPQGLQAAAAAQMMMPGAMGVMGIMDPMALQAQNYMAGLMPAADDGISRPGEVRYSNAEHANTAIKKLNGQILHGWPMEIRPDPMSQDGTKLIVENLAPTVNWQALKDAFKTIGKVEFASREERK